MITYICVRAHVHIDSSKKDKKDTFSKVIKSYNFI